MNNQRFLARLVLSLVIIYDFQNAFAQNNFWQQTQGPNCGQVYAVTINLKGHIFVGSGFPLNRIHRSTDNGITWSKLSDLDAHCLASNRNGHIFAGTPNAGIFRSTDDGKNWTQINAGLTSIDVRALVINSKGYIYAGTSGGGIFRSLDNGTNWEQVINNVNVYSLAVDPDNGYIFAGTQGNVYRSIDNGANWISVLEPNMNVLCLAINSNGDVLVPQSGRMFRSTDHGTTWIEVRNTLFSWIYAICTTSSGYIFVAAQNSYDSLTGIFRSTDNGVNWTGINTGLAGTDVRCLAVNSKGDIFADTIGSVGQPATGVFRLTNTGENWVHIGLPISVVTSFAIHPNKRIFAGTFYNGTGGGGGVFRLNDAGSTWIPPIKLMSARWVYSPGVSSLAINSSGHIFAGSDGVFRSIDEGITWTPTSLTSGGINALIMNSSGHLFAGTPGGGVFRSTNDGGNWTSINNGLTSRYVMALTIAANGHIFAGTFEGIFRSTDNGASWMQITNNLPYNEIRAVAVNLSGHIFAGAWNSINGGAGRGIFRSIDNGSTWTEINTGLINTNVRTFAIAANGTIFAGTDYGGAFISTNNGDSWRPINSGLTNLIVRCLAIDDSGYIWVGTWGNGVFRSTQSVEGPSVTTTYPSLYLSPAAVQLGGSVTMTGNNFTPNGQVLLKIHAPEKITPDSVALTATAAGSINYVFSTNTHTPSGPCQCYAIDKTKNINSLAKVFEVNSLPPTSSIVLHSPAKGDSSYTGQPILVQWSDKMQLGSAYPIEGAKRGYKYQIDVSTDGGVTWRYESTKDGFAPIDMVEPFAENITIEQSGNNFVVRVSDAYHLNFAPKLFFETTFL